MSWASNHPTDQHSHPAPGEGPSREEQAGDRVNWAESKQSTRGALVRREFEPQRPKPHYPRPTSFHVPHFSIGP
jgi:hypothetical protein